MESYLVRVYRRFDVPSQGLVGTVDAVGQGWSKSFHNYHELMTLLGCLRGKEQKRTPSEGSN